MHDVFSKKTMRKGDYADHAVPAVLWLRRRPERGLLPGWIEHPSQEVGRTSPFPPADGVEPDAIQHLEPVAMIQGVRP